MKTDVIKIFFIILIMLPNLAYFVFWIKLMRIEVMKIALGRSKGLFKLISCSMIDADEFERVHMREGVDEDELDIDDKSAVMQNQLQINDTKTKGATKRSEVYKDGTPMEDDNKDPQNFNASKKLGQKVFASEDDNFYGITPKEGFP
jgi:hypothetical protein